MTKDKITTTVAYELFKQVMEDKEKELKLYIIIYVIMLILSVLIVFFSVIYR